MSPTLFNVVMSLLAILPHPAGTQNVSYADDIILRTTGKDFIATIQHSLNILASKCDAIGLTISQH